MSNLALKETKAPSPTHLTIVKQGQPLPGHHEESALDQLQAVETAVATETVSEIDLIRTLHPEWFSVYEDTDVATAQSADVVALLKSAPNSFAKGLISGTLNARLSMAALTGKAF